MGCSKRPVDMAEADPCCPPRVSRGDKKMPCGDGPFAHFANMIPNCLEYARQAKASGRPIVGIMCEYTPRELILAAGAVPVCLCGGDGNKIPPAEEHLPANLCPLIKSTYGYHATGTNPFLEMADLVVAETTCDGKKKMYELMGRSRPMHVLELPQKPDDQDAARHWLSEVRKLRHELDRRLGVQIRDACIRKGIGTMNRERALRRRLAEFMKQDPPPLTGRQLLDLKSIISGIPADLDQYERAVEELDHRGCVCANKGKVRVLLTGVPTPHGAEKVIDIIEAHGGIVVCMENCTGLKPILDDVDEQAADPVAAIADKYFHLPCSVMTPNTRRLDLLNRMATEYKAQCIVELIWQACLTYDVESFGIKEKAEKDLHLPYLRIETDYSPSDAARIALRVEALIEMVGP